jgi:hypothetical protein
MSGRSSARHALLLDDLQNSRVAASQEAAMTPKWWMLLSTPSSLVPPQEGDESADLHWLKLARQYQVKLVLALSSAGLLAFVLAGLFGYSNDPPLLWSGPLAPTIHKALAAGGPLFLWFCALILTFIARHPALRERALIRPLVVTLIWISLVSLVYLDYDGVKQVIKQITQLIDQIFPNLNATQLVLLVLNFVPLTLALVNSLWTWANPERALVAPGARAELTTGGAPVDHDETRYLELVSGDLVANALLALLWSFLFIPAFLDAIVRGVTGFSVSACDASLPVRFPVAALQNGCPNFPGLSAIDRYLAVFYAVAGFAILIAPGFVRGVRGGSAAEEAASPATGAAAKGAEESFLAGVIATADRTVGAIVQTLRDAFARQLSIVNLTESLRIVLWPGLLLTAVVAAATTANYTQCDIHLPYDGLAVQAMCTTATSAASEQSSYLWLAMVFSALAVVAIILSLARSRRRRWSMDYLPNSIGVTLFLVLIAFAVVVAAQQPAAGHLPLELSYILLALAWMVISALAVVLALAVLHLSWHLARHSLHFLGVVGFFIAICYWMPFLALVGIILLLHAFAPDWLHGRLPYSFVSASLWVSFTLFVVCLILYAARRMPRRTPRPDQQTV